VESLESSRDTLDNLAAELVGASKKSHYKVGNASVDVFIDPSDGPISRPTSSGLSQKTIRSRKAALRFNMYYEFGVILLDRYTRQPAAQVSHG